MSQFGTGSSATRVSFKRTFEKKVAQKKAKGVSPSYGVHRGFIRNPNWPPGPGEEIPTDRRLAKRVSYAFDLIYAGRAIQVTGDLSATGAMFVLDRLMPTSGVELSVQVPNEARPRRITGEIIRTSYKGEFIAHHVRFALPGLGDAVEALIASGAPVV